MVNPCEEINRTIGELFTCSPVNGFVRIRTPYLYPDGDGVDLYLQEKEGQKTITDLGETLRWLRLQTVTQKKTDKQEALIQDICLTCSVEQYRGMFLIRVNEQESLASAITRLSQVVVRVSDLWFTFKTRALESIIEQVAELLAEQKIPFIQGEKMRGRSGRSWYVDFHTRHSQRSSFIEVLSTGSRPAANSKVNNVLAAWYDLNYLKIGQENVAFVSLFDDTLDIWSAENIRLLEEISDIAYWSRPEDLIQLVAPHNGSSGNSRSLSIR